MGVDVVAFGCRLNAAEADALRAQALAAGEDDLLIVNTCAVTNEAVAQGRQAIRRMAREAPGRRIVVTGCAVQLDPARFGAMPEVTAVLGNDVKGRADLFRTDRPRVDVSDIMTASTMRRLPLDAAGRVRAHVPVQTGCDHRCTFCIIPFGRGPSRSLPMGAVVDDIRRLVGDGVREAVLTGVDLTSYGADLPGTPSLGKLVQAILRHVPDLPRLRMSSIDQVEADEALFEALGEKRLMPHLHLSLQAGDDMVLKRMKRRHLRSDAIAFCDRARAARPDVVFGADLIAGFPTETDAMFARSLDIVADCGLTFLHVFPFSPRPGTPAARMPQVPPLVVKERAARLRAVGAGALDARLAAEIGRVREVLAENAGLGRTETYLPVHLNGMGRKGAIMPVRITGTADGHLIGEPADERAAA